MKHSETPWHFEGDATPYITNQEVGMTGICDLYHMTPEGKIHLKENYAENGHRIVACVNACEGIPNEYLTAGRVNKLINLFAACEMAIEALGDYAPSGMQNSMYQDLIFYTKQCRLEI